MPALRAAALTVRRGKHTVLRDVELTVDAGEIVALLGPNGAGKSTLLAALGRSHAVTVDDGSVEHDGRVATIMQTPGLARRSVLANVELALAWWGVPKLRRRKRAVEALDRMQAAGLAKRRAYELSGGEKRRVHLARAIAVEPTVLLLDEPFDGLDPQTHASLRDDTARALREQQTAVVVVLHDRADAWAMADRIVVLVDGRVLADDAPRVLLDDPPSAEVARFLGFDGELRVDDDVLLTRAVHVRITPEGEYVGRVGQVVGVEDGLRVRIETEHGSVWAHDLSAQVKVGDELRFAVAGGARFDA